MPDRDPFSDQRDRYTRARVLVLDELRKTYGAARPGRADEARPALDGVSLRLEPGEVFGLLGPNGAGKSTLVSLAVGLLEPDSGRVAIACANDELRSPTEPRVRGRIGLAPQSLAIYENLSARENLEFFAAMHGLDRAIRRERAARALEFVGLSERADQRPKSFSGGMARRLNLAAALVHEPDLLLLDEPTVGVDPQSRNLLLDNVAALRERGKTILYTTHYMEEAARLCDRVGILDRGKLLAVDRVDALLAKHAGPPVLVVELDGEEQRFACDDPYARLQAIAAERGTPPQRFWVERPSLEQVFLQLTGRSLRD